MEFFRAGRYVPPRSLIPGCFPGKTKALAKKPNPDKMAGLAAVTQADVSSYPSNSLLWPWRRE
jgi:hypothetical protein